MKVFGNPILTRAIQYHNLFMDNEALYWREQPERKDPQNAKNAGHEHLIPLTEDADVVLELLRINKESFYSDEPGQYFNTLADLSQNPRINPINFAAMPLDEEMNSKMLFDFIALCKEQKEVKMLARLEKISQEEVENTFPNIRLAEHIAAAKRMFKKDAMPTAGKNIRNILAELTDLGYDRKKFNDELQIFLDSFAFRWMGQYALVENPKDVLDWFKARM